MSNVLWILAWAVIFFFFASSFLHSFFGTGKRCTYISPLLIILHMCKHMIYNLSGVNKFFFIFDGQSLNHNWACVIVHLNFFFPFSSVKQDHWLINRKNPSFNLVLISPPPLFSSVMDIDKLVLEVLVSLCRWLFFFPFLPLVLFKDDDNLEQLVSAPNIFNYIR